MKINIQKTEKMVISKKQNVTIPFMIPLIKNNEVLRRVPHAL